jgi:hypothetical protein
MRPSVITGQVIAGGVNSVTFQQASGQTINLSALISSTPHYLEVVGHSDGVTTTLVGDRFEVNESTTITNANNVLAVDSASSLNTSIGTDFSGLVGYRITVRPHWTLSSLFGTGTGTNLNASTAASTADQVLTWTGSAFSVYFFRSGTTPQWRNVATGTANQDLAIIPPGVGVYFKRQLGSYSLTKTGDVRTNKFVRPLDNTAQLIASGFPVDSSPVDLAMNISNGYSAATTAANADQILTWTGSAFSIYFYRSGTTPQWRNVATGTTDQSANDFILASQSILLRPKGTPSDIVQSTPFTL